VTFSFSVKQAVDLGRHLVVDPDLTETAKGQMRLAQLVLGAFYYSELVT
jgi:hypothetical protein